MRLTLDPPIRYGWILRLAVLPLFSAVCSGCVATDIVGKKAEGEPRKAATFALTTIENSYEITRWWGGDRETLNIPRSDLPVGCETARFFLNDSEHELIITEAASVNWLTKEAPSLPDDSYPPCSLLVSYGSFTGQPALEGVVVTSPTGIIAISERRTPQPAAWALAPAAVAADTYLFLGALVTLPIWAPAGLLAEDVANKHELEAKEKSKSALPASVAACWTAIDKVMAEGGTDQTKRFTGFKWDPSTDHAYDITTDNKSFSVASPVHVDTFVVLRRGLVQFRSGDMGFLWTAADAECGLLSGVVVSTDVKAHN